MALTPELVAGILSVIGLTAMLLHRLGLIQFSKKVEPTKCTVDICPDPDCQNNVRVIKVEVEGLKTQSEKQWTKLGEIAEGVAFIKGKMSGA